MYSQCRYLSHRLCTMFGVGWRMIAVKDLCVDRDLVELFNKIKIYVSQLRTFLNLFVNEKNELALNKMENYLIEH